MNSRAVTELNLVDPAGHTPPPGGSALQSLLIDRLELSDSLLEKFLYPSLLLLGNPFDLPDMAPALDILERAVKHQQNIYLFGDKDVDGISSLSVLYSQLQEMMPVQNLTTDIPSGEDTYGLSGRVSERIAAARPDLLIALDCGTSNASEIEALKRHKVEVIVIDHHTIPSAAFPTVLINPRRSDSRFGFNEISTVGLSALFLLAFYLRNTAYSRKSWYLVDETSKQPLNDGLYLKDGHSEAIALADVEDPDVTVVDWSGNDGRFSLEAAYRTLAEDRSTWGELGRVRPLLHTSQKSAERLRQLLLFHDLLAHPAIYDRFLHSLDLAAIGSVTDMVPLLAENRIFVKNGLMRLRKTSRNGLGRLLEKLNISSEELTYRHLGWDIGPHLNAPGRMGQSDICKDLLLAHTTEKALELADKMCEINTARRKRTVENTKLVEDIVLEKARDQATVIHFDENFQPGVTGLVASRLSQKTGKPVVLMGPDGDLVKGSIRSAVAVNVVPLLEKLKDLLVEYGGHPRAAGFTLERSGMDAFIEAWQREFAALETGAADEDPRILLGLDELSMKTLEELTFLEPFGVGNPQPIFVVKDIVPQAFRYMGDSQQHAKFRANGQKGAPVDFMVWNRAEELSLFMNEHMSITVEGRLELNIFRSRKSLQFSIEEFYPGREPG